MPRYHDAISTHLSAAAAFEDLSHFDRASEWDPGVVQGSMLTPAPNGLGSRFALQVRFLGRTIWMEYEVVEFVPGERIVLEAETPYVRSRDTMSFESSGIDAPHQTVVTYDAVLEPKGAVRIASPLLALAFRRIGDRASVGLRERLCPTPS
jgi:Polyketide cyclase / dehydrase and lipid transport